MITETWFNHKSLVVIDGYNQFIKNRQAVSHGGVAIYVRKDIVSITETGIPDAGEMVWCNIRLEKESLVVGCIYRPPHSYFDANQEILVSINKAKSLVNKRKNTGLIIAGDFNHPDIKWSDFGGLFGTKRGRNSSIEMLSCLTDNELTQHVKNPTFGNNTLDLVITDDPGRIFYVLHGPPIASSKKNRLHCTLTWDYALKSENLRWSGISRRNFNKGNYVKFSQIMSSVPALEENPDAAVATLIDKYQEGLTECVPVIRPCSIRKMRQKVA